MLSTRRVFLKQIGLGAAGLGLASAFPNYLAAQQVVSQKLLRSTPEAQGISSAGIVDFLNAAANSRHEFHSIMIVRHGNVVAEGWWAPYKADTKHTMYSMSKSFTSTAVGLAVAEGKLKVDDLVTSFFPNDLPEKMTDNLAALKVKDLLTMSVGHPMDTTGALFTDENWVKKFLSLPIKYTPGSVFLYNSGATYMLSAIVQKVTGQKVVDYLKPRLFDPLGIEGMDWETCPKGINTGGWGLRVKTEDLAKFGQLYLQKGMWHGKQIIPAKWVEEATTFKIQQPTSTNPKRPKDDNDWLQGYCYQFWRCRNNAYRGDGAFGQYTIVLPDQDTVIAITSESPDMQGELDLVWQHLLPAIKDKALPVDAASQALLKKKLGSLGYVAPRYNVSSPTVAKISGKKFKVATNTLPADEVSFTFLNSGCNFVLKNDKGEFSIPCGIERWVMSETNMPGTPPTLVPNMNKTAAMKAKIAATGTWKDDNTFEMVWRYYETPHHDVVTCHFEGDKVTIEFMNSITEMNPSGKDKRPTLEGQIV